MVQSIVVDARDLCNIWQMHTHPPCPMIALESLLDEFTQ